MRRTLKYVAHHDDSCRARLVVESDGSLFCPFCKVYPDTQSTMLWAYCPHCGIPLNVETLECPACRRKYRLPATRPRRRKWYIGNVFEYKTHIVPGRTLPYSVEGYGVVTRNRKAAVLFTPTGNGGYDLMVGPIPENAQRIEGPYPVAIRFAVSAVLLALRGVI